MSHFTNDPDPLGHTRDDHSDDENLARAAERAAAAAMKAFRDRIIESARRAPPGTPSPFARGSAAAKYWRAGQRKRTKP